MPKRPKRICSCGRIVQDKCDHCTKQTRRRQDSQRGTAAERGYGYRWQQARERFLKRYPLCVHCLKDGQTQAAEVVDHKIPHKGDKALFWDQDNWQGLCKRHHDVKTATEDGGFGRQMAPPGGGGQT